MAIYLLPLKIESHGKYTANLLHEYLTSNHRDSDLKRILNIDLSFIDPRAHSNDYFVIHDVDYLEGNNYTLHYSINYYIYNLCKDMDIDNDYETSINFSLEDGVLDFDIIDSERTTIDEF